MTLTFLLSYFDTFYGPKILESIPAKLSEQVEQEITKFLSLSFEDRFIEAVLLENEFKVINLPFILPSQWARGNKEYLMLSILLEKNYKSERFESILKSIAEKIKLVPNMFKALYKDNNEYSEDPVIDENLLALRQILGEGYLELKELEKEPDLGQFLILGLAKVGKSSIIDSLKNNIFDPDIKPTLASTVIGMFFENYKFRVIDVSGQKRLRDKWWFTTKKPDAIVFVIDITNDSERLNETKEEFFKILERFNEDEKFQLSRKVPLLICINKIDLVDDPDTKTKEIYELLDLDHCNVKFGLQQTSAATGKGIKEGFKWIFKKLLKFA